MFKKNAAIVGFGIGHFINATTGAAVTTGTPTCKRTLDGTGGSCANAASYNADGAIWEIDLASGDLNADMVDLSFTMTDCLPISYSIKTDTYIASDNYAAIAEVHAMVDDIALTSAALNALATGATVTTGTQSSGTYASTHASDGATHQITAAGNAIDFEYAFSLGVSDVPVSVAITGRLAEQAAPYDDTLDVYAWDYSLGTPAWEHISPASGDWTNSATLQTKAITLFGKHADASGNCRIRFAGTSLDANTVMHVDQIFVSYARLPLSSADLAARTLATADYATAANLALVKAKTDTIPASPAAIGSAMTLTAAYDAAKTAAPASTALSNAVWVDAKAGYLDASIAGVAAAVWAVSVRTLSSIADSAGITTLLSRLSALWAAQLDVAVSTRLADADYTAPTPGGDATEAKQDTILAALTAVKGATFDTATDSLEAIRNRGDAAWVTGGTGGGATAVTYTVTDSVSGDPISTVLVEVFTDIAMSNKTAGGYTDAFGQVAFDLDSGTYYLKRTKAGYTFTNPDTEVVA